MTTQYKERLCRVCKHVFTPERGKQRVCSAACALADVQLKREAEAEKQRKANLKARKEALKSLGDLKKEAQRQVNKYVRIRDQHKPCVSCGQDPYKGKREAGHFRTRAAAPQLALNTLNIHTQCSQCNNFKSGNITPYRIEMARRIGEEMVLAIEHNNEPANFTPDYLRRLRDIFSRRARHLERLRARILARDGDF